MLGFQSVIATYHSIYSGSSSLSNAGRSFFDSPAYSLCFRFVNSSVVDRYSFMYCKYFGLVLLKNI